MGGSTTISTSETRIEAIKFQSSAYGVVLPVVYGVTRIPGNLVWYGGFKAIPHTTTQSQGGKGGSVKTQSTSYTYTAAILMGLCEGDIAGVAQVWRGKTLYTGGVGPTQILAASQNYTVPVGGGSVTVTNSATYAADVSVISPSGGGENGSDPFQLSEGYHYTRVGGTYTFPSNAGGWGLEGLTLTINYQYTQAGATQSSLQQLGLSLAKGTVGQATWSFLTTSFPSQALGYSGIAYVYASAYDLGTSASVDNHNFEVQAQLAYSISSSVPDADPSQVGYDITTNYRYGVAGFPASKLGSTGQWSNYCRAAGLFMSPAFTEQMKAAEALKKLTDLTNTALVWSEGVLKFIPYGDAALTANGATYTPNTAPIYDLTDDHFLDKDVPVRLVRKPQSDAWNQIQIEFLNRGNQYNVEIAEAKDQANIDVYGLRSPDVVKAHWICDASIARTVAQLMLQRALYVRNTYEFKLPWNFALLEPMDLVTLTDATLGLSKAPVRITEVTEAEDGELSFVAEDFPQGSASATVYPSQSGLGFSHNYNVAPGSVSAPTIFEAPGALTVNGLEVYVAATGLDPNWGGCHVWVSLDGSNYKQVGTINGGSRYGALNAAATSGGTIGVTLLKGTLTSGSVADAAALNTLCYIGGTNKEFFSYQTASLVSALQYTLGGSNVRGVYGTTAASHASNDPFVRIDDAIAKSGPIDLGYIGKTIHIKLTSFNIYGGGEESLASVTDYTYAITGTFVYGNAGAQALQGVTSIASDNLLSAGEKPPIILEYTKVTGEQSGIDAQATAYGITPEKTAYDGAVSALTTYLGTLTAPTAWNNTAGDTTIVGTTFRTNWANLYAARQTLLNKIDAQAGTVAAWTGVSGRPTNLASLTGAENLGFNMLNASNWASGASGDILGGTGTNWYQNGVSSGGLNNIQLLGSPDGSLKPLWVATSGSAAGTSPEGGIGNTTTLSIDNTKAYRFITWMFLTGPLDGSVYQGIGGNQVENVPAGTANSNPYFNVAARSGLAVNKWYMFVGYVFPAGYSGAQLNLSGIYDATSGQKIANGTDFRWAAGQAVANLRTFQYYTNGANRYTVFANLRFEQLSGTEPTLSALMADAVLSRANSAYTGAVNAQSAADAANAALTNIASDSILSPSEKPSVVQDYSVIIGEQSGIDAQASAYGITTEKTAYDNAVSALTAYLGGLSGWNTVPGSDVAIVGTTFRSNFANVYTTKQALLNKIAQVAGTLSTWAGVSGAGKPLDYAGVVRDTRSTNDPPSSYPMGITQEFKTASVIGLPAGGTTYCLLETNKQWTDSSGDNAVQYAYQGSLTYRRYAGNSASSWGAWIQDLDRNAYTGDLNASSDVTLVGRGCTILGNSAYKSGGTNTVWDSDAYSKESYTNGAYATAVPAQTNGYVMFGLNSDPTTDGSYTSLDFAWYFHGDGTGANIYESGSGPLLGSDTPYAAGDVFTVTYDGMNVRYMKNGAVFRTVRVGGGKTYFWDSSFYSTNAQLKNIQFGPLTAINPAALPNTGGGALNNDPFFADPSAWKVSLWGSLPTFVTDTGTLYSNTVASSDTGTGTRSCTTTQNIPVSAGKTYRISVWVRSTSNGTLFLRYEARNPDGSYGTEYYPGVEGVSVPADGAWRQYSGVFAPASGVNAIAPRLILAYGGSTGYMQAQDLRIEEMTNTGLIVDNAVTYTSTYSDATGVSVCPAC